MTDEELYRHRLGPLHPRDDMFTGSHQRYYAAGASALEAIDWGLTIAGRDWSAVTTCLDLPCGYGRVLRHLVQRIPPSGITAADLATEAVDFCVDQFSVRGLYSKPNVRDVVFPAAYDLIWVGSLFTHLTHARMGDLLGALAETLSDDGVLVFSAVGDDCLDRLLRSEGYATNLLANKAHQSASRLAADYVATGWAFVPYAGADAYGLTFLSTNAIQDLIADVTSDGIALLGYHRAGWNRDHDVYVVGRRHASPLRAYRHAHRARDVAATRAIPA